MGENRSGHRVDHTDDWKLVKRAIRQKYIGKENADKLLEYAATVENTETDPRIVQLLLAER